MSNQLRQGKRGKGENTYACWEELRHLKIEGAEPVYIYKRLDRHLKQPIEQRTYQVNIPIPSTRGVRKSLRTPERQMAILKAEQEVLNVKVKLA